MVIKLKLDPCNAAQMAALAAFADALAGHYPAVTPKPLYAQAQETKPEEDTPAKPEKKKVAHTPKKEMAEPETPKKEAEKSNVTLDDIRKAIAERKQDTEWAEIRVQAMTRFNVKNITQLQEGDLEDFFRFVTVKDQSDRDEIRQAQ